MGVKWQKQMRYNPLEIMVVVKNRRRNILIISILFFAHAALVVVYIINLINKNIRTGVVSNVTKRKAVGYRWIICYKIY